MARMGDKAPEYDGRQAGGGQCAEPSTPGQPRRDTCSSHQHALMYSSTASPSLQSTELGGAIPGALEEPIWPCHQLSANMPSCTPARQAPDCRAPHWVVEWQARSRYLSGLATSCWPMCPNALRHIKPSVQSAKLSGATPGRPDEPTWP